MRMRRLYLFMAIDVAVSGFLCLDIKHKRELNYDSNSLYYLDEYKAHEPRYQRNVFGSKMDKLFKQSVFSDSVAVGKKFMNFLGPDTPMKIDLISATQTITQCLQTCPVVPDYRPVCGTNGVTYQSLASLLCARTCSVVVDVMAVGPCFISSTITTTPAQAKAVYSMGSKLICQKSCTVTPEENPICGTDGVTYMNFGHFLCAVKCGKAIRVLRYGKCDETLVPSAILMIPTTTQDYRFGQSSIAQCLQNCPVNLEHVPVCGSDGVTYANPGRLMCAKLCGLGVGYKHQGHCPSPAPVKSKYHLSKYDEIPSTSSANKRLSLPNLNDYLGNWENADQCLNNCSIPSNYKPMCGTNGVTYINVDQLICANSCGLNVRIKHRGVCAGAAPTIPTTTTTMPFRDFSRAGKNTSMPRWPRLRSLWRLINSEALDEHTTTPYPNVVLRMLKLRKDKPKPSKNCMRNCPVTSEYNPVCGSNAVTYGNFGKLICARNCGVDVNLSARGPCSRKYTTISLHHIYKESYRYR